MYLTASNVDCVKSVVRSGLHVGYGEGVHVGSEMAPNRISIYVLPTPCSPHPTVPSILQPDTTG